LDVDNDKWCDRYNVTCDPSPGCQTNCCEDLCYEACHHAAQVLEDQFYFSECMKQCINLDNCADPIDHEDRNPRYWACSQWVSCAFNRSGCKHRTDKCSPIYKNRYQTDLDGDGVGDMCELSPTVSRLYVMEKPGGSEGGFGVYRTGSFGWIEVHYHDVDYEVYFRGMADKITWEYNVDSDPTDDATPPKYWNKTRTGVRLGACACDDTDEYGNWDEGNCHQPEECNGSGERNSMTLRLAWNPINAPECNDYDTAAGVDPTKRDHIENFSVCHEKVVDFNKNPLERNRIFNWEVNYSRVYDHWNESLVGYFDSEAHPGRTTKIRAAWPNNNPNGDPSINYFPDPVEEVEVAYSPSFSVKLTTSTTIPHGEIYLGPEFIISRIPRIADPFFDPLWRDRPGYLLGVDSVTNTAHIYGLKPGALEVEKLWNIDASGMEVSRLGAGTAGSLPGDLIGSDKAVVSAVFLYEQPLAMTAQSEVEAPSSSHRLLIGIESDGGQMDMISAAQLLGSPAPSLMDAQIIYVSRLKQIVLVGRPLGSNIIEAWKLKLLEGEWDGPHRLSLESSLSNYTLSYDAARNSIYVLGGESEGASAASRPSLHLLSPVSMQLRQWEHKLFLPPDLGAGKLSLYLDPVRDQLFIYGEKTGASELHGLWRISLASGQYAAVGSDESPAFEHPPFLYHDGFKNMTWIGSFEGASIDEPVQVSILGPQGQWTSTEIRAVQSEPEWPVTTPYNPDTVLAYPWSMEDEYELPGQPLLATIQAQGGGFGVEAMGQSGDFLGQSLPVSSDTQELAVYCPPGQACLFRPRVDFDPVEAEGISYTLDVVEANPLLEATARPKGRIRDLEIAGQHVYVAGLWGLASLSQAPGFSVVDMKQGIIGAGLTGIEPHKGYLFGSRLGLHGLVAYDISEPTQITKVGDAVTVGVGWDIALSADRAYIASGILGVGIYDISNPMDPKWSDSIFWIGGRSISVAARKNLLAVGRADGLVVLYDISGEPERVGEIQAKGRLSRVEWRNGRLWVLGKWSNWVEIYDVTDPSSITKVGEINGSPGKYFRARFLGPRSISFEGREVRRYRFYPL